MVKIGGRQLGGRTVNLYGDKSAYAHTKREKSIVLVWYLNNF